MKCKYRGFELEVIKQKTLNGWDAVISTAYVDGNEIMYYFTAIILPVRIQMSNLKCTIDDIIQDEEVRKQYIDDKTWNEIKRSIE